MQVNTRTVRTSRTCATILWTLELKLNGIFLPLHMARGHTMVLGLTEEDGNKG